MICWKSWFLYARNAFFANLQWRNGIFDIVELIRDISCFHQGRVCVDLMRRLETAAPSVIFPRRRLSWVIWPFSLLLPRSSLSTVAQWYSSLVSSVNFWIWLCCSVCEPFERVPVPSIWRSCPLSTLVNCSPVYSLESWSVASISTGRILRCSTVNFGRFPFNFVSRRRSHVSVWPRSISS